jgi:hypothetical protein
MAVFLAVVALFGIIGPWLVWRTLRSERHIAINTIDYPKNQFHIPWNPDMDQWFQNFSTGTGAEPHKPA